LPAACHREHYTVLEVNHGDPQVPADPLYVTRDEVAGATPSVWLDQAGAWRTTLRGPAVLADSRINKGTAFTPEERETLDLVGVLPHRVLTLEDQVRRVHQQIRSQPTPLAKHLLLGELRDRNQVLFYRLLSDHLTELLPIVYTPTVGEAIQSYSHEYRRARGVYLSAENPESIERSLLSTGMRAGDVDLIVATDAEAILGIGDWGIGGMGISVGKLTVYTAAAGIDPNRAIAVALDVGTNNQALLDDPLYLGLRRVRVSPDEYDRFLDAYVDTASRLFPRAVLHWEDFASANARRILDRYRERLPTFNDDVQGTGAVNLGAVLAAVEITGAPLREHRIVIFGAGTAGIGVADQLHAELLLQGLTDAQASARIWCLDRQGLVFEGLADTPDAQRRYARGKAEVTEWAHDAATGAIGLLEVVRRVRPTVLIGASTVPGAFTEQVVGEMAAHVARPVILPLSNPTHLAEALPEDLVRWTDGRALVAAGSPFSPVAHNGVTYHIGQANNALIFPGLGLGAIAAGASRVTDGMIRAAASAIAQVVDPSTAGAPLLPPVDDLRETSHAVAVAVAQAALFEGVATAAIGGDVNQHVRRMMWRPAYRPVLPADRGARPMAIE
jgi:malate dehydrogenase (oxaloacetate-decarboxylating)